jgi:serine/threonine protein phosphatase PrpC
VNCPVCDSPVVAGDSYCEACGHHLTAPRCAACDAPAVDAEGYCERCGLRQPTVRDEAEIVLGGGAAGVTHKGLRRARNEDAMALLDGAPTTAAPAAGTTAAGTTAAGARTVAVVCDGVGSSPRADEASALAVRTAAEALARGAGSVEAFELAREAVTKLATSLDDAPACTYVSAVVADGAVTLGWAGDSRAYWLPAAQAPAVPLTEDHAAPTGEITAWLGADAADVELHVRGFTPPGPGLLLICSDGLWRYLGGYAVPPMDTPLDLARELLRHALDSGGHDNVTIVLIPLGGPHG